MRDAYKVAEKCRKAKHFKSKEEGVLCCECALGLRMEAIKEMLDVTARVFRRLYINGVYFGMADFTNYQLGVLLPHISLNGDDREMEVGAPQVKVVRAEYLKNLALDLFMERDDEERRQHLMGKIERAVESILQVAR